MGAQETAFCIYYWCQDDWQLLCGPTGSPGRWCCTEEPRDWASTLWAGRMERGSSSPSSSLEDRLTCPESWGKETDSCRYVGTRNTLMSGSHYVSNRSDTTRQTWASGSKTSSRWDCYPFDSFIVTVTCLLLLPGERSRPPERHPRTGRRRPEERRADSDHRRPLQTRRWDTSTHLQQPSHDN